MKNHRVRAKGGRGHGATRQLSAFFSGGKMPCPHPHQAIREGTLVKLRKLGEVGQFVLGILAGYTEQEIAQKREWNTLQMRQIKRQYQETNWEEIF